MQLISGSVGANGANAPSDVALVQAILVKIPRPAGVTPAGPFLKTYDGTAGELTNKAIQLFQDHYVFVSPDGLASADNPGAEAGLVAPNDATWSKLLEKVDKEFADMRVLKGGKIVYLSANDNTLQARLKDVDQAVFAKDFVPKVILCIEKMYSAYGIALHICADHGDRRDFQDQYTRYIKHDGTTHAGPGESYHNFGYAVDLGFQGFRWLSPDGTVVEDDSWLNKLHPKSPGEEMKFWKALQDVGTSPAQGLFRGPDNDQPHLQNGSDLAVDMAASLADLLNRLGTMRWYGHKQHYDCDLGLGGDKYPVRNGVGGDCDAAKIWNREALTIETLIQALTAQQNRLHPTSPAVRPGPATRHAGGHHAGPLPVHNATQTELHAMRQALRKQFELVDANPNWRAWRVQPK
jgi:hypothetical protein